MGSLRLDTPIQYVKGVGPRRAELLERAGIRSAGDLLQYKPFRYEDRTNFRSIAEVKEGEEAVIQGAVAVTGGYTTPFKRVKIFQLMVSDPTGSLEIKFFNQPYLEKVFRKGQTVILFGQPRLDEYTRNLSLVNPDYEVIDDHADQTVHTGRIVPVYRKIGFLTSKSLRQIIFRLLADLQSRLEEPLPQSVVERYGFPERTSALRHIHFPDCPGQEPERDHCLEELQENRTPAHQRFIFEEFFEFQLGLCIVKRQREALPKRRRIQTSPAIRDVIKSILPFRPTSAQKRVLKEIVDDLSSPRVMNRLLQGDVGSGKTIVALQAMIVVIENGYQTVLMAPTEILAEQHYQNIRHYLARTGYRIGLLTGSVKGKQRKEILSQVQSGEVNLVVGTHAVIQKGVDFKDLSLVVIDEQHRFGVLQRSRLMEKGSHPDTLVMTATPIPRSLALTVYGDLDLSVLDELPPGRKPISTIIRNESRRRQVYSLLRRELSQGRQAYVVYPLVEESKKVDLRAAAEMAERLRQDFPDFELGLIHGRLKPAEKEALMRRFKAREIALLVATSVIEVGIDVPNATLMLIEHADRFGLSQLHQLRGRIGRGAHSSLCILMTDGNLSSEAYERLAIMERTNNGFKIAEKDLEIRGPGEFVGTRQSGIPEFLFGNIVRDRKLLESARLEAENEIVGHLKSDGGQAQEWMADVAVRWRGRYGLYSVG